MLRGPVAQRSEPPAHNRVVPGSNPGGPTTRPIDAAGGLRRRNHQAPPARCFFLARVLPLPCCLTSND